MKKLLLFAALAAIGVLCHAQNGIKGKIKESITGKPIEGSSVYIPDLKIGAISDSSGYFTIKKIPAGTYLLEVSAVGYAGRSYEITVKGISELTLELSARGLELGEVIVTGVSSAIDYKRYPMPVSVMSNKEILRNSSTNVIDAIAQVRGVSAMTNGQSISKPVIRGLGYNRVLTVNDGVQQVDQVWFDEFGIEADPDAVSRYEILKGPASLVYGSDAIAGVINLIPEKTIPEGQTKGNILFNYQTNNGLVNNMFNIGGTKNGVAWSARIDNTMAHAYKNPNDGYVLNSQFSNFNADATIGLHRKWGYTQLHSGYFELRPGIVDGTRDSATGIMERQVSYPDLNGGSPSYELPTHQEQKSYTPFVIDQRIRHTKIVWDNNIAIGNGRLTGIFSWQKNQRQEANDPTIPNTPDIYYSSNGVTYDVRYLSQQINGFNISGGVNGVYQSSKSLGTLLLIPDYNFFQIGAFAIASKKIGKLDLTGGLRYDTRSFHGLDHWVDSTTQEPVSPNAPDGLHEFVGFTSHFNGLSFSAGGTYNFSNNVYVKANIARGWRAPSVVECAANGVHDGTVVYEIGDHSLKSESSLEEDVSFGISSKDVSLEINAFNNSISDFIYAGALQSVFGGDSINNSLNAAGLGAAPVYKFTQGKAELYGGELAFTLHPSDVPWIEFNSTVSMVFGGLKNVADSVKSLPFVPPTRVTADVSFPVKSIGNRIKNAYLKFGLLNCFEQKNIYLQYAIYSGLNTALSPYEYAASTSATKGYTVFNAGAGGDIVSNGKTICQAFIICNNLFNTAYMDYMSRFKYYPVNYTTGRVGVFNMGRNLSIKILIPLNFTGERKEQNSK